MSGATLLNDLFRSDDRLNSVRFFTIRGCMKSGTNWVGNLLNLHPEVSCSGEFHWERLLVPLEENLAMRKRLSRKGVDERIRARMERLIKESIMDLADDRAVCVGDRTPGRLEPIILPDARHISVQRDGRDVLVSRAYHQLRQGESYELFHTNPDWRAKVERFRADPDCFEEFPHELLDCREFVTESATMWHETIQADLETRHRRSDLEILFVRYEDIHKDVEASRHKLYEFLDVDPQHAGPLDEQTTPGFPKNHASFYRHGRVGDWDLHVTPDVRDWFESVANESLRQLGYRR